MCLHNNNNIYLANKHQICLNLSPTELPEGLSQEQLVVGLGVAHRFFDFPRDYLYLVFINVLLSHNHRVLNIS